MNENVSKVNTNPGERDEIKVLIEKIQRLAKDNTEHEKYIEKEEIEKQEKLILVPITRKGYWLFRQAYDNCSEAFKNYEIYSDRYLTKLLNGDEFKGRKVLLFDDMMVQGNNMFYFYTLLTYWDAIVVPFTLMCYRDVLNKKKIDSTQEKICEQIYESVSRIKPSSKKKDPRTMYDEFWEAQKPYEDLRRWLTSEDIARESVEQLHLFQKKLYPMSIDLPFISEGDHRYVTLPKNAWERLKQSKHDWYFVENCDMIKPGNMIEASFFEGITCVRELSLWGEIESCVVKCKYNEDSDEKEVKVSFVPFVIIKSMSYFQLVELFCTLYEDTEYLNDITEKLKLQDNSKITAGSSIDIKKRMFIALSNSENLYRTLFRAIILYFSIYVGCHFQQFLKHNVREEDVDTIGFDWDFMAHHSPKPLINTLRGLVREPEKMKWVLMVAYTKEKAKELDVDWDNINKKWQTSMLALRQQLLHMRFYPTEDFHDILTLEKLQQMVSLEHPDITADEKRIIVTRIIMLGQEEGCFRNYIKNDKQTGFVQRGFRPGENATKIFGKSAAMVISYIFAFYLKVGKDVFYEKFDAFMKRLDAYFYHKEYFPYLIDPTVMKFCTYFFSDSSGKKNNRESKWDLENKISQIQYMVADEMKMNRSGTCEIFQQVYEWEL